MIEIAQARRVYGPQASGSVLMDDGRIVIHMGSRSDITQWASTTYTSLAEGLTRVIERDPNFYSDAAARLQNAIERAKTAQQWLRRVRYEDVAVIRRAEALLRQIQEATPALAA